MTNKIKNTFWFRHFLMCSKVANLMIGNSRGWSEQNYAKLTIESDNGRFGNDQMLVYFESADSFFAELHCSEEGQVFSFLEDEGVSIETLSELSVEEINNYYDEYCIGCIDFDVKNK